MVRYPAKVIRPDGTVKYVYASQQAGSRGVFNDTHANTKGPRRCAVCQAKSNGLTCGVPCRRIFNERWREFQNDTKLEANPVRKEPNIRRSAETLWDCRNAVEGS